MTDTDDGEPGRREGRVFFPVDASRTGPGPGTGSARGGHLDEVALRQLAEGVARSFGRGAAGGAGAGECLIFLEQLARALYPRTGESALPGGVRPAGTADDLVLGIAGPGRRLARGATWRRVTSWDSLADAVRSRGPGATGLVLWQRRTGPGHALAVHNTEDGPRWVDLQRAPGGDATAEVTASPPGHLHPVSARAVVLGSSGYPDVAWPSSPESAIPAYALTDPPDNNTYGAIGVELELPRVRLTIEARPGQVISQSEKLKHGDVLFSNEYLQGVVEQTSATGNLFLELVGDPVAVVPGDVGFADPGKSSESIEYALSHVTGLSPFPVSALSDYGFTIHSKAENVIISGQDDDLEKTAAQFTIGVPVEGLYDLYQWSAEILPPGSRKLRDISPGLIFANEVAYRFATTVSVGRARKIPLVAAELLHPEELHALRGYAVSVFTHAMAPLRQDHFRNSGGPDYRPLVGAKQFLVVASRHPVSVIRIALPERVRKFLGDNAEELKKLFAAYAARFGDGLIGDPFQVTIHASPADRSVTVGAYLDDAFLPGVGEPRVRPRDFEVGTEFDELDNGKNGGRPAPLTLNEIRQIGGKDRYRKFGDFQKFIVDDMRNIFAAIESRRRRADRVRSVAPRERSEVFGRLGRDPVVRDIETLLRQAGALSSLSRELRGGVQIALARNSFLDAAAEIAANANGYLTAESTAHLAAELKRGLDQLQDVGRDIVGGLLENPGSAEFSGALMPWAAATRAARRLLAVADRQYEYLIPEERFLTNWRNLSAVSGLVGTRRSSGIRAIDASVEQLLGIREDQERLAQVLISIASWQSGKEDPAASARAAAADGLERRVTYELGAVGERHEQPITSQPQTADDAQFFDSLAGRVSSRLGITQASSARVERNAAAIRGIYWSLAPADRSRAAPDELSYEIALRLRSSRGAQPQVFIARVPDVLDTTRQVLAEQLNKAFQAGDLDTVFRVRRRLGQLEGGIPALQETPPAHRPDVEPGLVDREYDLAELLSGADLTGDFERLGRDPGDQGPGAGRGPQETGRLLAEHIRRLVTAQGPLGQARLILRPSAGDTAVSPYTLGLAQAVADALNKRVILYWGEHREPVKICPLSGG